jgi:hypothetical protein
MKNFNKIKMATFVVAFFSIVSCTNNDADLQPLTYSTNPDVFVDTFSSTLDYFPYSGSVQTAFSVDIIDTYDKSTASMRFDVPNANDPDGTYAGAAFITTSARDLSGYDCLTFWAKATTAGTINTIGYGIDFEDNAYSCSISGLKLSTNWKKYYIPIADASKLTASKGLFHYAEGAENTNGYTFWIDDLKYEKLGTILQTSASILAGVDETLTSFSGVTVALDGLTSTYSLPNGTTQILNTAASFYEFTSSNTAVATVDADGNVSIIDAGTSVITATLGGVACTGSLTITSNGAYAAATTPTVAAANVISIFSDTYTNVPVNFYNGYWAPWQNTTSADFTVGTDNVLAYNNLNFVGIEFSSPTINATSMTHLHLDVFVPNTLASGATFQVKIADFGADGVYGGGNDTESAYLSYTSTTSPALTGNGWMSLDIPLSSFTVLTSRAHLAQIIIQGVNLPSIYVDNIYLYN